jgi:hypothetical protein
VMITIYDNVGFSNLICSWKQIDGSSDFLVCPSTKFLTQSFCRHAGILDLESTKQSLSLLFVATVCVDERIWRVLLLVQSSIRFVMSYPCIFTDVSAIVSF